MHQILLPPQDVATMIREGKTLLLSGDETLLADLPEGSWIGGTTNVFMACGGGQACRDKIFVTDLSGIAEKIKIQTYDEDSLGRIGAHYPVNGFSFIIIPSESKTHISFARNIKNYSGIRNGVLAGWISGVHPEDIGKKKAKVFAGQGTPLDDNAVVMHVSINKTKQAVIETINPFTPDLTGPILTFESNGFVTQGTCWVNGEATNLAKYILDNDIDIKLPIISEANGQKINVSIKTFTPESGEVSFYAPIFRNEDYRFALPIDDYIQSFEHALTTSKEDTIIFSCNCILNYLYAGLEGKKTKGFSGPITFGEIAYQLLNQTLVYVQLKEREG